MATNDTTPVYEVEPAETRVVSIERGGRLGLTLNSETKHETAAEHLKMLALMLLLVGWGATVAPGPIGALGIGVGAWVGGYAFCNWMVFRGPARQEDD